MSSIPAFRNGHATWGVVAAAVAAVILSSWSGVLMLLDAWFTQPEFSHGIMVPLLAALMAWQRRTAIAAEVATGSWAGVVIVVLAAVGLFIGKFSALFIVQQYALVMAIYGLVLSFTGPRIFRLLLPALAMLIFMVPLPAFLMSSLSAELQLLSSKAGVWLIRSMGISVYLEGNVIDLGSYKLEVAEACSGLRYLFPLMTIGFMMAYLFKAALWKRAFLFLSTIPITLIMNSIRIALIGVTVDRWGPQMAEGVLHDFEGWVVFMVSMAVLIAEMSLLIRFEQPRKTWRSAFGFDINFTKIGSIKGNTLALPKSFVVGTSLIVALAVAMLTMPQRAEVIPTRTSFSSFANQIGPWTGRREAMEGVYLDALKVDDYYMGNFLPTRDSSLIAGASAIPLNLYIAWYDSQRAGQSAHSPRTCLPGGGWRIEDLQTHRVANVAMNDVPLVVNRAVIVNGEQRQLVYYWFQQRGRVVTNEYMVKWYLFWDALTRNRTDGALVRLIAPIPAGASIEGVEESLTEFVKVSAPQLPRFIPN